MIKVRKEQLDEFTKIKRKFLPGIRRNCINSENYWKSRTDNWIWQHLFRQVIVVGNSGPGDTFWDDPKLRREVSYSKLTHIADEQEVKRIINRVLRKVGTRYASANISKCRKTNALAHDLKVFKNQRDGPKGLLRKLSRLGGRNADKRRIKYLMRIFEFVQSKSARDYLMELGLVRNAIALDVRVQNILRKAGVQLPKTMR